MKGGSQRRIRKARFVPLSKEGQDTRPFYKETEVHFLGFERKRCTTFKYLEYIFHLKMNLSNRLVRNKRIKQPVNKSFFVVLNKANYNEYYILNEFKNSPWKNWFVLCRKEQRIQVSYFYLVGKFQCLNHTHLRFSSKSTIIFILYI